CVILHMSILFLYITMSDTRTAEKILSVYRKIGIRDWAGISSRVRTFSYARTSGGAATPSQPEDSYTCVERIATQFTY
ncbi:MAG: hypothetical protein J6S83_11620, partial [Lachnospiraceae bacterium]|nr:hypothetical protein [Lachnospiraceae bacterium]